MTNEVIGWEKEEEKPRLSQSKGKKKGLQALAGCDRRKPFNSTSPSKLRKIGRGWRDQEDESWTALIKNEKRGCRRCDWHDIEGEILISTPIIKHKIKATPLETAVT